MIWTRARVFSLLGVLCLLGQGTLLFNATIGPDGAQLPWPGLFLGLTCGLAFGMSLAFSGRKSPAVSAGTKRTCRLIVLLMAGTMLAMSIYWVWLDQGMAPEDPSMAVVSPATTVPLNNASDDIHSAMTDFANQVVPQLQASVPIASQGSEPGQRNGDLFRLLNPLPGQWQRLDPDSSAPNLAVVLWRDNERLAWTSGAEAVTEHRSIVEGRQARIMRQVHRLTEIYDLEIQVFLYRDQQMADLTQADIPRVRARMLLALASCWMAALLAVGYLLWGRWGFVGALWLGRCLLAAMDFFQWTMSAFPHWEFPAAPQSWASLVDPAYFATPFAFGWFASTADAVLTAILVATSIWALLLTRHFPDSSAKAPRLGALLAGLLFGIAAGLVLLALHLMSGQVAENANARLIGTGISLNYLSFWGLHLVLMLGGFSVLALLVGAVRWVRLPARQNLGSWVGGLGLAGAGALLVTSPLESLWWGSRLILVGLAMLLWIVASVAGTGPRFLQRFVWPAALLLAVVWNYTGLREIYDGAELRWLQRKGQLITESGEEWMRFLLEDALVEMVEKDSERTRHQRSLPAEIWRDEPAFRLWRQSALPDIGSSALVEIIDNQGREESLFATGFLRELQYEVISRGNWVGLSGAAVDPDHNAIFQLERRLYSTGQEEILAAEISRHDGRGWIRVELPVRSWRIDTLMAELTGGDTQTLGVYRPRSEVQRPLLLVLGDNRGWLSAGDHGFPGQENDAAIEALKSGRQSWAYITVGQTTWQCLWRYLPTDVARSQGEGFLLGLARSTISSDLLDLSRLVLLNLLLFGLILTPIALSLRLVLRRSQSHHRAGFWEPGFQERFLAGYLLLGLLLLLVVGMSVDRVGHDRIQAEARSRTVDGLSLAVEQLRSLLIEQARSLAESEYIADLLVGQLAGQRPAGPLAVQQAMVFSADGELLLDETLSDLDDDEARMLLTAGRSAPVVIVADEGEFFAGTVIPLDLSNVLPQAVVQADSVQGHGQVDTGGFFFYRQRLQASLLGSLAELVRGQATVRMDGRPVLASHPEGVFTGRAPQLENPHLLATLLDHPAGPEVFAESGRPFAFTGHLALPAFAWNEYGRLEKRQIPAILAMGFPDREREYTQQRRGTLLFLAGLANLILLTALLLALLMSWRIFRPLRMLLTATRALGKGDFQVPLPESGYDEVGRLAEAFSGMRSDLQSARDRLAAREQFLATVLNRVPVGVVVLNHKLDIVTLNPAGTLILADYLPGLPETEAARGLLDEFQASGDGPTRIAAELRSADGLRTLRGAMAPLALPGGRTDTMLVFEDVTEFLETKKMALNAELTRQVAHEIKNPLTPIQLSVQLLQQAWEDGHPQLDRIVHDTVGRVLDQVELLRAIAAEFSLLGRPEDLDLKALDLRELLGRVVPLAEDLPADLTADGSGPLVLVDDDRLPLVVGHADSLLKILGNLMQNSLDAQRDQIRCEIQVSWRITPSTVALVWRDNGTGLADDVADRLFDPYFSTKSKGTGLGLAICRNLVGRMGGTITLTNRMDGPGATAELTLPRDSGSNGAGA